MNERIFPLKCQTIAYKVSADVGSLSAFPDEIAVQADGYITADRKVISPVALSHFSRVIIKLISFSFSFVHCISDNHVCCG